MRNLFPAITAALVFILLLPSTIMLTSYAVGQIGLYVPAPRGAELEEIEKAIYGRANISAFPGLIFFNITVAAELSISEHKTEIYPGDVLDLEISVKLPDIFKNNPITLEYNIADVYMEHIYAEHETRQVSGSTRFIKRLVIPHDLMPGTYALSIGAFYKEQLLVKDSCMFNVKERERHTLVVPKAPRKGAIIAGAALFDAASALVIFSLLRRIRQPRKKAD
ncbi:MAG TPA: hypothetical protein HA362_02750 [Nanoarchaeota archaeon]|nr:hypothetical protein [Nanoarchaeota archaeon]